MVHDLPGQALFPIDMIQNRAKQLIPPFEDSCGGPEPRAKLSKDGEEGSVLWRVVLHDLFPDGQ